MSSEMAAWAKLGKSGPGVPLQAVKLQQSQCCWAVSAAKFMASELNQGAAPSPDTARHVSKGNLQKTKETNSALWGC